MQPWQIVELNGTMYQAFVPSQNVVKNKKTPQAEERVEEESEDESFDGKYLIDALDEFNQHKMEPPAPYWKKNSPCRKNFCFGPPIELTPKCPVGNDSDRVYKCTSCHAVGIGLSRYEIVRDESRDFEEPAKKEATVTYNCSLCDYVDADPVSLQSHVDRKHPKSKIVEEKNGKTETTRIGNECVCEICDYKGANKRRLKEHILRKHNPEFKHECEICGKKFKVKGDMRLHIRFKHKEPAKVCEICGRFCSNSNSLYVHQKWAHFKPSFECSICKRRMVSQENLDQHTLSQHADPKRHVCEQCGKSFNAMHRLKQHIMTHTGEKPHRCKVCGRSFARKTAHRQHLLIHTGEKPYVCDICGKCFSQKPGLICHRKSHPGELPPLPVVHIDHIINNFMQKYKD